VPASGNEPQPVGHELAAATVVAVVVVDEPANAGAATAPAGTATARMAKAVRIGR